MAETAPAAPPAEDEILFEHRGAAGLVTLNRPRALNALTHDMCVRMKAKLEEWAGDNSVRTIVVQGAGDRAFCAGGDIRTLYESGRAGGSYPREFYRDEYRLDAAIKHYPKPYVALISGIVMGGGVGVSAHGMFRVADETTTFAMPETGIGLFPDVGGSYFLPRLPGELGMYLALTGARLRTADVVYAGIATHVVLKDRRDAIVAGLCDGRSASDVVHAASAKADPAPLESDQARIDRIFSGETVEDVIAALEQDGSPWSAETLATIRTKSPTSTKLAFRQLREGRGLSFDECLRMEFRMVNRIIAGHDFYEGVRATIIEKDGAPKWQPARLSEVSDAAIAAYFAPLVEGELPLG